MLFYRSASVAADVFHRPSDRFAAFE